MKNLTHLTFLAVLAGFVITYCQSPSIATWSGNKSAAVSMTFDDGDSIQIYHALTEMNKRHLHGTFFLVTWNRTPDGGWYRPDWPKMAIASDSGHEVAGHSCTHTVGPEEVGPCIDSIQAHFPNKKWFTWAYPAGNTTAEDMVKTRCVGARGWFDVGMIESSIPSDIYDVNSITGWNNTTLNGYYNGDILTAISQHKWLVETIHCVDCPLGPSITAESVGAHCDTLVNHQAQVWVATFGDAVRYIRERASAKLSVVSSDANAVTLSLTDTLTNKQAFNEPLTIKMALPKGWTQCMATQAMHVLKHSQTGDTVLFDAVPDSGNIVISNGVSTTHAVVMGSETLSPLRVGFDGHALIVETGSDLGRGHIALFTMKGECVGRWLVTGNAGGQFRCNLKSTPYGTLIIRMQFDKLTKVQSVVTLQ